MLMDTNFGWIKATWPGKLGDETLGRYVTSVGLERLVGGEAAPVSSADGCRPLGERL